MDTKSSYLALPLRLLAGSFEKATLEESVCSFLEVLLTTPQMSKLYFPNFGCRIWEYEYGLLSQPDLRKDITLAIQNWEERLQNLKLSLPSLQKQAKHFNLTIQGDYAVGPEENREFHFTCSLFRY